MNNTNQPINTPEIPSQSDQHPINNQRGNLPIILGVLVLLLIVGGGAYYLGTRNNSSTTVNQNAQQSNPIPIVTSEPSPSANNEKNNIEWKNIYQQICWNYPELSS